MEFIYVVSNPSIPNKVKVGRTTNLIQRIKQLQSSGVPTSFKYEFVAIVENSESAERTAHYALRFFRVARNREFFSVSAEEAIKKITADLGQFKIHWEFTPKNKTTLSIESNYSKIAKRKLFEFEKQLEEYNKYINELKIQINNNLIQIDNLKNQITTSQNSLVNLLNFFINSKEYEKNKETKKQIQSLSDICKNIKNEIEHLKRSKEQIKIDLKYEKQFYKEDLVKDKIKIATIIKNYELANLKWYCKDDGMHCDDLYVYFPNEDLTDDGVDVQIKFENIFYHIPIRSVEKYVELKLQKKLF